MRYSFVFEQLEFRQLFEELYNTLWLKKKKITHYISNEESFDNINMVSIPVINIESLSFLFHNFFFKHLYNGLRNYVF